MRIRSAQTLELQSSDEPRPTVEIDLGSIPEGESLQSLLRDALIESAQTGQISTLRAYFTHSINFHVPTSSAFVMALGTANVLQRLYEGLQLVTGLRMRYSDYVVGSRGEPLAHLEDGTLWLPLDVENWYADADLVITDASEHDIQDSAAEEDDPEGEDSVDDDDIWLAAEEPSAGGHASQDAPGRGPPALRTRAARSDASIGSIARTVERMLSLPEGSVLLCGPDKRPLRKDARIATLRRRWE